MATDPSTLLTPEMVIEVFSYLERRDLKAVRLVSRPFETLASPRLFTKAYIAARRGVMDAFKQITSHPVFCHYIREVIYDASWFEPRIAACEDESIVMRADHQTFVRFFEEQERILSDELPVALEIAFKSSRNIRSVTFADFSRYAYLPGDRAEDLGDVFFSRCETHSWVEGLADAENQQRLQRKYGAFKLLIKALSASASLESVECIAAGNGASSSEIYLSCGIPHTFFSSRREELPRGVFDGLRHLRTLDLSIIVMGRTVGKDGKVEVDLLKELLNNANALEVLRLVRTDYPSEEPAILSMAFVCGSKTWRNLRTLELRHFQLESSEVLDFLFRHKHCLRNIVIDDLVLLDRERWVSFCQSVHAEYRNLHIAPNSLTDFCQITILGTTDAPEGEAVPIDWAKLERLPRNDDYDLDVDLIFGDESGSYSENESFKTFPENTSTTSEELEFSAGSDDDSDLDSLLGPVMRIAYPTLPQGSGVE